MQNPLSEYRSSLFATHDNIDESLSYLSSMVATLKHTDQSGINVAVHCLINTLAEEIDRVYHPSKNISINTLVENYLNSHLAERVEEIINDRVSEAIDSYMDNEFDITKYEDDIDWYEKVNEHINEESLQTSVENCIKEIITFEVRVS
jgi:hypothetical protein